MDDWRSHPITASEVLVDTWLQRLEAARKSEAYKSFRAVSETCYSFYKNSARFMWEDDFRKKFIGTIERPKFEITINKAFEYVAIFGPYLFWDYPHRQVKARELLQFAPEAFGDTLLHEQFAQQKALQQGQRAARATLMQTYLNYSQREQPNGLAQHSRMAVQDALIKGRGVLVPRAYSMPGSTRRLTGLFWESVDNLRIDPDCADPLLETATWVAIKHIQPVREVEQRFHLKRGTLHGAGNLASYESVAMANRDTSKENMVKGKSNDLMVWWEIWSKCGVGGWREEDHDSELIDALDEVVGDHAYLCVAANVPWLLNAPPEAFHDEITDDEVAEMLGWPFPCYRDARWPLVLLDFCHDSESPWPVAPLSAALGELICMNVLTSAFVEHAYENRKSIIALLDEAAKDFEAAVSGNKSPAIVRIKGDIQKAVTDMISFIERPAMNTDILAALDYVAMLFDKRTGLVDFMYGAEQKVSRSARDIAAKEEKTAIRPEKMSKDVAAWQTEGATLEMLLATLNVQGKDIPELIGDDGAYLWDSLIYGGDPERVMREMVCYVEATDVSRPNRERDLSNLQLLAQQVLPFYMEYAASTGDYGPANTFIRQTMEAMQQPSEGLEMGMSPPQPDPEAEAKMQETQGKLELQQQKAEIDRQKAELDAQGKILDLQIQRELGAMKIEQGRQELELDAAKAQQEMAVEQEKAAVDLTVARAQGAQSIMLNRIQGAEKVRGMREQSKAKAQAAKSRPKAGSNGRK